MLTLLFSGRRRQGQALEDFYQEFESTHVNLMRQAQCSRFINRYTQNKPVQCIDSTALLTPIDSYFDSHASLAFVDLNAMSQLFMDRDYNNLVKPHAFIDPTYMTFEFCEEHSLKSAKVGDEPVKVIYYWKAKPNLSRQTFRDLIDGPYSELIKPKTSLLSFYKRHYCYPKDSTQFMRLVYQQGKISEHNIIEELWFDNLDNLKAFHQGLKDIMIPSLEKSIDFEDSFSLVVTERVVFGTLN